MVELQCIEQAYILKNEKINADCYEMVMESPLIAKNAKPGQFIMVACGGDGGSPLLRRPLSIYDSAGDRLSLLYRVVGTGTRLMAGMAVNTEVSILGPLGHGFVLAGSQQHCLVGGGIGIAPMLFLAREIRRRFPQDEITILAGARTEQELLSLNKFQALGAVRIATDDGSHGHHGFVTELLARMSGVEVVVYTCGPGPMMKGVATISREKGWPCQVSLESAMACGMGACLGCAVERSGIHEGAAKYVHVCKDGPVFKAEEIWA